MNDLIPSISIAALVQARAAIVDRMEKARTLLLEADAVAAPFKLGTVSSWQSYQRFGSSVTCLTNDGALEALQRRIDAAAWRMLMNESGMLTIMDASAREKWERDLRDAEAGGWNAPTVPELNADNIASTFAALRDEKQEMFERGVVNVFRALSWDYKTNLPQKFGKRVVIRTGRWSGENDRIDDLDRVFHVFDGKPQPDHRVAIGTRIAEAKHKASRGEIDAPYMSVKLFANGNGHVTFKQPPLVDQLNLIIAHHYPHALPGPRV